MAAAEHALGIREKVDVFEIVLSTSTCWPGGSLDGLVRLVLKRPLAIQCIDLLVQGSCHISWQHSQIEGPRTMTGDEVCLNEFAELINKSDSEMMTLSVGEHIFPFITSLPENLPSTFAVSKGRVAYTIKALLRGDRNESGYLEPCVATKGFAVLAKLPFEAHLDKFELKEIQQKLRVKNSSDSRVAVTLYLPRTAYDTNDMIALSADISNMSGKIVRNVRISLIMEAVCSVKDKEYREQLMVTEIGDNFEIPRYTSRRWREIGLKVPANLPPSGLPNSNLMSVSYWLVFRADVQGSSRPLLLQTPVTIGVRIPDELKGFDRPTEPNSNDTVNRSDVRSLASGRSGRPQVLVNYERPNAMPPTARRQGSQTDSQIVTMRLTDDQEEPHSPYAHEKRVSTNPLFNSNGDVHRLDHSRECLFQNLEAGLDNDVEDVLY